MAVPLHIRKRCDFLSDQIRQGIPLHDQQRKLISSIFKRIADGEDPRSVFCTEPAKGKKYSSEESRAKIHDVIQRIFLDLLLAKVEGTKMTTAAAIRNHLRFANEIFGYGEDGSSIDEKRVRSWWDRYKDYRKPRSPLDPL